MMSMRTVNPQCTYHQDEGTARVHQQFFDHSESVSASGEGYCCFLFLVPIDRQTVMLLRGGLGPPETDTSGC